MSCWREKQQPLKVDLSLPVSRIQILTRLEWHGMDPEVMFKSLNVLVKRGKAQVFGSEGQEGVKFF